MILTGILFHRRSRPSLSPHTTKPRPGGCHGPPRLLAILWQCTELCVLVDTSYQAYHKNVSLDTLNVSPKKIFVLELQWVLLAFAFWPHQKTGFEASERNKDASHPPTARKLTLDAFHAIRVAAFLARASPNRILKAKRGGEE